jgi:hypothetical protein
MQPTLLAQCAWQPGDFLVRVDGIEFGQAHDMQKLVQEGVIEGTPFVGEIPDFAPFSTADGFIGLRVRPRPYIALHLRDAQVIDKSGKTLPVIIRRVEAAPPSSTLGRFGDLIVFLEGVTLEQAQQAQSLVQVQDIEENERDLPNTEPIKSVSGVQRPTYIQDPLSAG